VKIAWSVRLARDADVPGLEKLIPLSVRALQARYYSTAQNGRCPWLGLPRSNATMFRSQMAWDCQSYE
jgi:hypothetical protein